MSSDLLKNQRYEWWTRDSSGIGWRAGSEQEARDRLRESSHYRLYRRKVTFGEWEEVERDV